MYDTRLLLACMYLRSYTCQKFIRREKIRDIQFLIKNRSILKLHGSDKQVTDEYIRVTDKYLTDIQVRVAYITARDSYLDVYYSSQQKLISLLKKTIPNLRIFFLK